MDRLGAAPGIAPFELHIKPQVVLLWLQRASGCAGVASASRCWPRWCSQCSAKCQAPPARRYGAKVVEEHGLKWFNAQTKATYALENWIDEGHLALEFPTIHDNLTL
ncbi:hypothetical protein HAX54_002337, partial [Datura stramonium]|nr:hypothetical protein [Datura stramonium]